MLKNGHNIPVFQLRFEITEQIYDLFCVAISVTYSMLDTVLPLNECKAEKALQNLRPEITDRNEMCNHGTNL